jgi:hypothetical protein
MTAIICFALALAAQPAGATPPSEADKQRQADVAWLAPAKARQLKVTVGRPQPTTAALHAEPLLRWSNPTAGSVYGEVFVWTVENRPAALASIYRWYHPYKDATVEVVSVSPDPVAATDGAASAWEAPESGIEWRPLEGGPKPAQARNARLVQFRALTRRFSAELADQRGGDEVDRDLRLLGQPVYRYETGSTDGALFAFVETTDPEAWVLVECDTAKAEGAWRYAVARMNADALRLSLDERVIADWPKIVQAWKYRQAHYTLFGFDPQLLKKESPDVKLNSDSPEKEKP